MAILLSVDMATLLREADATVLKHVEILQNTMSWIIAVLFVIFLVIMKTAITCGLKQ